MRFFPALVRYGTILLAIAGVVGMVLILQQLREQDHIIPPPPVTPPAKPVDTRLAATGIIEALEENVAIGSPTPGLVNKVYVKVSAQVEKGDPLFQLDDRELQAQLVGAKAAVTVNEAQLNVARAQLTKMKEILHRLQSVPDQRAISQDDLINRTNDVAVANAEVVAAEAQRDAAKAEVKRIEMLIERMTVRAPRAGTMLQVNIREGEYASAQNRLPAMILGDLDKLQIRADVDEQNAMAVREQDSAVAYVKGDSTTPYPLQFVRIEPFVIPKQSLTGASTERVDTRVLQVIYQLSIPDKKKLYVGQQVDVMIGGRAQ